jgi:serine/threonine protein kinase
MYNLFKEIRALIFHTEFDIAIDKLEELSEKISDTELRDGIILSCVNFKENRRDKNSSNDTVGKQKATNMLLGIVVELEKYWHNRDDEELVSQDQAITIDTLVKKDKLKEAMNEFNKLFHLIDEEQLNLEDLQSRFKDSIEIPTDVIIQIKERFKHTLKRLEDNIPKFLEIDIFTHWVTEQNQIIEKGVSKILPNSYKDISFLSYGQSGWYFRAKQITSGEEDVVIVVLKVQNINDLPAKKEIEEIIGFRRNNIIKVIDYNFKRLPAYVVLEHINGTTLDEALNLFGSFPLTDALKIIIDLVDALQQIQKYGILHSNIRPSKIFIDQNGSPCISSLDIIKFKRDDLRSLKRYKEECQYLSPEVLEMTIDTEDIEAVEKSDLFSLGLLLLEMISGKSIFYAETTIGILEKRSNFFKNPSNHLNIALQNLQQQKKSCKALKDLLKEMLEKEPGKRTSNLTDVLNRLKKISTQKLLESPLLNSFHTCYDKKRRLIQIFYDRLFDQIPDIRNHFKSMSRQYLMLRYAVNLISEIEQKEDLLKEILSSENHKHYSDVELYKTFLNILRDTVRDLLGDEWDEKEMLPVWDDKIQKVIKIVEESFQERDS